MSIGTDSRGEALRSAATASGTDRGGARRKRSGGSKAGGPPDPQPPLPTPSAGSAARAGTPPPWFRLVVWDSLVGACCPLLPVPVVDDMALSRVRRRMVTRLAGRWGAALTPEQVALLAGQSRGWTTSRFAGKVFLYPFKRLFRKIVYFLAMKEAVDTFSLLFHQGYLLHAALIAMNDRRSAPKMDAQP